MKIAVLILGILGSLATTGLGAKWVTDYEANRKAITQLSALTLSLGAKADGTTAAAFKALERTRQAGYGMIGLGIVALVGAALVFKIGKISGVVMLIAAAVPAVLAPWSLVASVLLVVGGILGLCVKTRAAAPATSSAATAAAGA